MSEHDTFTMLPAPFASALEKHGYSELTPVQCAVLAPELLGKDLRISSRTGSGKTVALGLVVGPLLIDRPAPPNVPTSLCAHPRILLVAPTRELAAQIGRELEWLFAELKVGVCVVTGGTSITGERRQLAAARWSWSARRPHCVITRARRARPIQAEAMGSTKPTKCSSSASARHSRSCSPRSPRPAGGTW